MEGGRKEGRAGGDDVVVTCNKWHRALGLTCYTCQDSVGVGVHTHGSSSRAH